MTPGRHRRQPVLRVFDRLRSKAAVIMGNPPMRARPQPDIIAALPARHIMPTAMAGHGVVGYFIGAKPCRLR